MIFLAPRLLLLLVCILNVKQIVHCLRNCPPLVTTPRMTVNCTREGQPVSCTDADEGTIANFECKPFYEASSSGQNPSPICKDGNWSTKLPDCVAECGKKSTDKDYPWQAALYMMIDGKQVLICGGTLLNEKVILTAAHCVTDLNGKPQPKEKYTIAVGKYYSPFNDSRDFRAQYSKVDEIIVSPMYRALHLNYFGDLALLVVEDAFQLNSYVAPVCIDWSKHDTQSTADGANGIVTGWGFTKDDCRPSDVLKEINVTSVSVSKCEQELPADFVQYLTPDKMCAASISESTSVSEGDGGAGLVFKNAEDNRYYIHGITSIGPKSRDAICAQSTLALYTKVASYLGFISEKIL